MLKNIYSAFTRRERITFLVAIVAMLGSGIALLGWEFVHSTEAIPAAGGEYTEGSLGQPAYVNPVIASTEIDKSLVRLVFSNIRDVAEKIEPAEDGRTWHVRLKEGLVWHDGEKLTSDDVIFTVQKIQDGQTDSPLQNAWQGVAVQRLSELELQFSLVNPYAFFEDTLKTLYILPKHLFADIPPSNWRLSDYNLKPVGSGPYQFVSYEKRSDGFVSFYKLAVSKNYSGEKPLIETFDVRFFPKRDEMIGGFNSGQIDAIAGLEPKELAEIKRPYETFSFRLPNYYAVFLNQSKNVQLKDAAVRNALGAAIDRESLIATVLGGHGVPATGPIPEYIPTFNATLGDARFSLEKASATLSDAGWKMNTEGVREKKIDKSVLPLEITLTVPQIDFLVQTAELLRDAWEKLGYKIVLDIQSPEQIAQSTIKNRDYEMLLFGNILSRSSDLYSFWHSSERFSPGLNLALYNNKKADTLIEAIRQNLDVDKRASQFNDLQKLIVDDMPALFLYSPDYLYITNKNLHGLEAGLIAEPAERFLTASKWYLKTTRVLK
jgi:peptide/nickel transport system substrate-binding protein